VTILYLIAVLLAAAAWLFIQYCLKKADRVQIVYKNGADLFINDQYAGRIKRADFQRIMEEINNHDASDRRQP